VFTSKETHEQALAVNSGSGCLGCLDPEFRAFSLQLGIGGATLTDRGHQGNATIDAEAGGHYAP